MQKHIKVYFEHHGYTIADFIPCEYCKSKAVDIHHLVFRSQGGKDEIDNLMALCRGCHNDSHNDRKFNEILKIIHDEKINY